MFGPRREEGKPSSFIYILSIFPSSATASQIPACHHKLSVLKLVVGITSVNWSTGGCHSKFRHAQEGAVRSPPMALC